MDLQPSPWGSHKKEELKDLEVGDIFFFGLAELTLWYQA